MEMDQEVTIPILGDSQDKHAIVQRLKCHAKDELQSFRTSLKWLGLDQSSRVCVGFSWVLFILFTVIVPGITIFVESCDSCNQIHGRPYNNVIQVSQSVIAAIAFVSLSRFVRKYGLRKFLFLDQLCDESNRVARSYTTELNSSFRLLSYFLLPCLAIEFALKIWWYITAPSQFPFLKERYIAHTVMCLAEILSKGYRAAVFFLVCVLFRLTCSLQILRFQDFTKGFSGFDEGPGQAMSILKDHVHISHQLRVISHRFRFFIVGELICITFSQFVYLFITTSKNSHVNLFTACDLALCSVVLMTGLVIFLHSAARITHKAQAVKTVATRWHAIITCNPYDSDSSDDQSVSSRSSPRYNNSKAIPQAFLANSDSDFESSEGDPKMFCFDHLCQNRIASYQTRQAVVKYLEHNTAGITVFGLALDRSSLHMIFGIELSLITFILGKTISISA